MFSCFGSGERSNHAVTAARSLSHEATLEIKETEEFLASQMSKLSVEERDEAIHDMHCVGEDLEETPEMVEKSLAELDNAIKHEKNATYEMAKVQNRAYVEDSSFRLKFLRANMHDVNRAVRQMVSFLEQKAIYFGIEKVAQEITLNDLTNEDIKFMRSGLFHIQQGRDRSGRVVLYLSNSCAGYCTPDNLVRPHRAFFVLFYDGLN